MFDLENRLAILGRKDEAGELTPSERAEFSRLLDIWQTQMDNQRHGNGAELLGWTEIEAG